MFTFSNPAPALKLAASVTTARIEFLCKHLDTSFQCLYNQWTAEAGSTISFTRWVRDYTAMLAAVRYIECYEAERYETLDHNACVKYLCCYCNVTPAQLRAQYTSEAPREDYITWIAQYTRDIENWEAGEAQDIDKETH